MQDYHPSEDILVLCPLLQYAGRFQGLLCGTAAVQKTVLPEMRGAKSNASWQECAQGSPVLLCQDTCIVLPLHVVSLSRPRYAISTGT